MSPRLLHPPGRGGAGARAAGAVRRAVAQDGDAGATAAHETLIVITANNEAIRYEFGRAFRAHMARKGRNVEIDWRSPGGAAEIARTLASEFAASFERHWREDLHRRWTAEIAAGFSQPAPDGATGDVADARRAFLASDVGAGVDVVFGGGSPEFVSYAAAGRIVDAGIVTPPPGAVRPRRHPGRARRRDVLGSRRALGGRLPLQLRHLLQPRRARAPGRRRAARPPGVGWPHRRTAASSRSPIRPRARPAARRWR